MVAVLFIGDFADPIFDGAIVINCDHRYIDKEMAKVFYDVILVVEEGTAHALDMVTACHQHLLGRAVVWPLHCFPNEVKFAGGNHVAVARFVVEHPSHVLVFYLLLFYSCN